MKRSLLSDIVAFFFIFLFLYTGAIKLTEIQTFQQQLSSSPLMASLSGIIAWALPIFEILLAVALFIPKTRPKALYVSAGLMAVFTIYVVVILLIDQELTCSCGGIIEQLTPKQHVAFNTACVILAVIGIIAGRRTTPSRPFVRWTNSVAICLFGLIGWSLFSAFRAPVVPKTGLEGRVIPSVPLLLIDSSTWLKTDDIPTGKPFAVVSFSPWCVHCQALTVDITHHIKEFKDAQIYYITADRFKNIQAFYNFYKLQQYPNITMGRDTSNAFFRFFDAHSTPLVTIFDSKKRLKKVMPGQPKAADLIQAIYN